MILSFFFSDCLLHEKPFLTAEIYLQFLPNAKKINSSRGENSYQKCLRKSLLNFLIKFHQKNIHFSNFVFLIWNDWPRLGFFITISTKKINVVQRLKSNNAALFCSNILLSFTASTPNHLCSQIHALGL